MRCVPRRSLRVSVSAVLLLGCSESTPVSGGSDGSARADAAVDAARDADATAATSPGKLDVLFVLDDGNMLEKLQALASQVPRLLEGLVQGDVDGDGTADARPIDDLQVGVVSTDMGTGAAGPCPGSGDDAILQTTVEGAPSGCWSGAEPFRRITSPGDVDALSREIACIVPLGWMGCGFEQPLEAALKAISPSDAPVLFAGGGSGHGDGANAGLVRDDARLLLVVVTDEDDCSAADPELYNPESTTYGAPLGLRCATHPDGLHPLERYLLYLLALKREPAAVRFALVAGVPPDLADDGEGGGFEAVLADPRMQTRPADGGTHPAASCEAEGVGAALPPRRLVRLAHDLQARGAAATAQSVCQTDFGPAIAPILRIALR